MSKYLADGLNDIKANHLKFFPGHFHSKPLKLSHQLDFAQLFKIRICGLVFLPRSISSSFLPSTNQFWFHCLQVIRLSNLRHQVNEDLGEIQLIPKFAGGIVGWKSVVVVVPTLTKRHEGANGIVCPCDLRVERSISVDMGEAVDKKCDVEGDDVSGESS